MKAMILAAGRGERLRPLTDHTPKPLIDVGGRPLIGHHLGALARAGFGEVVINVAYRADQIRVALGDGTAYGLAIRYSVERPGELDTGGGVRRALPLLGPAPFVLVSADVWSDIGYGGLSLADGVDAHWLLVDNPSHHPGGDFALGDDGRVTYDTPRLTYAGVGVFRPELFRRPRTERFPLSAVMRDAIARGRARGTHHRGRWIDVGRPQDLIAARAAAAETFGANDSH